MLKRIVIAVVLLSASLGCQTSRSYAQRPNVSAAERNAIYFHRVEVGMKPDAVTASWGDPCTKKTTTTAEGRTEQWIWCSGTCPNTAVWTNALLKTRTSTECVNPKQVTFTSGVVSAIEE